MLSPRRRWLFACAWLVLSLTGCTKNVCLQARDKLLACQMAEGTFNFDGECSGRTERAMRCILRVSCSELRAGRLVSCLAEP